MPVVINGTTGITTPDLDSAADITANGVVVGEGGGSGATNTTVGAGALSSNTTGSLNTAVGNNAGNATLTGIANTFVGSGAGLSSTGADGRNTFVGQNAGQLVTTGVRNTVLGRHNGTEAGLDISTSDNNIVLADGSGTPRLHFNGSGNLNMPTTATSQQAGVYTTAGTFSIDASVRRRVQVVLGNYTMTKFRIYALRTNSGDSIAYWEGFLNNNFNQSYSDTFTSSSGGGTIGFTFSSSSAGVWNFDFNTSGSGAYGWFVKEDNGVGSVSVTTY